MFRAHMSCFQNLHRLFLVGAMEGMTDGRVWWIGGSVTIQSFAAKSIKARANRGKDGTHGQGNRNHWGFKAMKVYLYERCILVLLYRHVLMYG